MTQSLLTINTGVLEMELLCDEQWLSSPLTTTSSSKESSTVESHCNSFGTSKEDREKAFRICLEEEITYIPEPNYVQYLWSKNLIIARLRSIHWFIKSKSRLNLSIGTVFYAANYLDRFISLSPCNEWQYWMVELLSIACLSVAAKFNDTITPTLHEIQMDDVEHLFEPSTIQQMELILLQALEWRLSAKTSYSFVELFAWNLQDSMRLDPHLHQQLIMQVNELLLGAVSDTRLLQFRPSVVAVSAIFCCLDKLFQTSSTDCRSHLMRQLNQCHKNELMKCHKMMEEQCIGTTSHRLLDQGYSYCNCPSSPTTVLLMKEKEGIHICDFHADLSLFQIHASSTAIFQSTRKKQRREE